MKNILITWSSKWIWKYLSDNLKKDYQIFGISRTPPSLPLSRGIKTDSWSLTTDNYIDLTNFSQFDDFCEKVDKNNIKFDTIIFNAGVWAFWEFENISSEKYKEIINLNLLSPILFLQKLLAFLEKKWKIIFIWSIISKKFFKYGAVYGASKFGLRGFAWALKNEFPGQIHIINPRLVETDFHKDSKIKIDFNKDRITSLDDILKVIQNIILREEKRFEIDL